MEYVAINIIIILDLGIINFFYTGICNKKIVKQWSANLVINCIKKSAIIDIRKISRTAM